MANSKSNIYPIQLQGAELNLNKYDAEIKQYSGFNKNNSPFVGGCLSNVFTKEDSIEGATSKNTYIAFNDDVYQVTTEGLFKNGEKLIDYTDNDFFNIEELNTDTFPESTVYVYDEETYIYIKDGKFFYHSGKIDRDFLQDFESYDPNVIDYNKQSFNIKKRKINDIEYDVIAIAADKIFFNSFTGVAFLSIYKKNEDGTLNSVFSIKENTSNYHQGLSNTAVLKLSENNASGFDIALLSSEHYGGTSNNNYLFAFDGSSLSLVQKLPLCYSNGSEIPNLRFTSCVPTDNYIIASPFSYANGHVFKTLKIPYTVDFTSKKVVLDVPSNETYFDVCRSTSYYKFLKNWGVMSVIRKEENGENTNIVYTVDDDVTVFGYDTGVDPTIGSHEDGDRLQFNLGAILNGMVLVNNNEVTGISLPGGTILVTEWNSVAGVDYIFFGDNTEDWRNNNYVCIWKSSKNKWYKLFKSIPSLRIINNNIIINVNNINNSYNLNTKNFLLYASAWNNRRPYYYTDTGNTSGDCYMATSINEYMLDRNASLLLNPVLVTRRTITASTFIGYKKENNFVAINIYQGDTVVDYLMSQVLGSNTFFRDDNLIGLPFPSNTDGNIQYSPSLFAIEKGKYGNLIFVSEGGTAYKLMIYDNKAVMSYFLSTAVEGLQDFFTIQGQLYGILDNQIYNFSIVNEIANRGDFIVSVEGLQFVGNTPYEALFFSKTNRCLYSFTGANILQSKQFVDKINVVKSYKYNPATQSIFLLTDIGVLVYSLFGIYCIDMPEAENMFLLNNGVVLCDNEGHYRYIRYYKEDADTDYIKENIKLETCFYGMNDQTVTINDCLYLRLFSEEHEEGEVKISATTISLQGRKTEDTIFKFKESDWDKMTHSVYFRYQPKEQRGLGISFSVESPFKIASMSVGSQPDAILIDKVSKGAINAPSVTTNNKEW